MEKTDWKKRRGAEGDVKSTKKGVGGRDTKTLREPKGKQIKRIMKKSSSWMLCLEITKCNNAINQMQDKTKRRNGHSAILHHLITRNTCGGASVIGAGIATFICCDVRPSSISKKERGLGGAIWESVWREAV